MNHEQLNEAIASMPGDKVTREQIDDRISAVDYHVLPKSTVTVCNITLDNGFSVRGESACVAPENYNREIGEKIAYDNAYQKLWPLFGFLLAEARHLETTNTGETTC